MRDYTIDTKIKKVLSDAEVNATSVSSHVNRDGQVSASIDIEGSSLTFEKLDRISKALNTKKIDVGSGYSSGGCETCGYGESSWVELVVSDIKLPTEE